MSDKRLMIDGDVLRYEIGAVCQTMEESFGTTYAVPHSFERVENAVDAMMERIMEATDSDTFEVFLSAGSNFRNEIAITDPYKGQRKTSSKPLHWGTVGNILIDHYGAWIVHGAEADDALSIFAREDPDSTIIASRDKDLRIVPCWHYAWKCGDKQPEIPVHKVDELGWVGSKKYPSGGYKLIGEGLRFFYGQVIAGDAIDNYKGCPRSGPQAAAAALSGCNTEQELWEATYWTFHKKLGPEEGLRLLIENARLAWLLETGEVKYDANAIYISPQRLWEPPAPIPTGYPSGPVPECSF